jgi:hypothetical protein
MHEAYSSPTLKEHVAAWPDSCLMLLDPRKVNLLNNICHQIVLIYLDPQSSKTVTEEEVM